MKQYTFLEEALSPVTKKVIAIGAGGIGAGALVGRLVGKKMYKAPDDQALIDIHNSKQDVIQDKINSVNAEIQQLEIFRERLANGEYDVDVPIQNINEKLAKRMKALHKLRTKLSYIKYQTTQDLRDQHKKSYLRKASAIGGAIGGVTGGGLAAAF